MFAQLWHAAFTRESGPNSVPTGVDACRRVLDVGLDDTGDNGRAGGESGRGPDTKPERRAVCHLHLVCLPHADPLEQHPLAFDETALPSPVLHQRLWEPEHSGRVPVVVLRRHVHSAQPR